jgi:hypothetical protein
MIKYKLACKNCETTFDSWFASSKEFEKLKKKRLLVCHICNSTGVDKTLMAPSVRNNKKDTKNDLQLDKYENVKKLLKAIKNLLKIILSLLVKILLMKHDLFIIILKKNLKVSMEMLPRKILWSLRKRVLTHK